jgi:hypothetical protein
MATEVEEIERLRDARGRETVTFGDVADHMTDFVRQEPGSVETVRRLAMFLARVERVQHLHRDDDGGSTVTAEESPRPTVAGR